MFAEKLQESFNSASLRPPLGIENVHHVLPLGLVAGQQLDKPSFGDIFRDMEFRHTDDAQPLQGKSAQELSLIGTHGSMNVDSLGSTTIVECPGIPMCTHSEIQAPM